MNINNRGIKKFFMDGLYTAIFLILVILSCAGIGYAILIMGSAVMSLSFWWLIPGFFILVVSCALLYSIC